MLSSLRKITLLFLFLLSSLPTNGLAWNAIGHMIVANIAYQNLQPSVRVKVDELVSYFQKEYPNMNSLMQLSVWPDSIRFQRIETFTRWHYIDVPFSDDGTNLKDTIDTDNGVWALQTIQIPLKNVKANNFERARFLAFLTHIVGDLHQPLHTITRISHSLPNGDKGGNLYYIRYNNVKTDLHSVWDQGLGVFVGGTSADHINQLSNSIIGLYPHSFFGDRVKDLNPHHWTKEGMKNAKEYVYNTPENQAPQDSYIYTGQKFSEQQVALAGYRLALLLNQLLGSVDS